MDEEVSAGSAKAVEAVLEIAIGEITKKKKAIYGYTADQFIAKLQADPESAALAGYLLKDMRPQELERLLVSYIPPRYALESLLPTSEVFRKALVVCFHTGFELAPDVVKTKVAEEGARIVRELGEKFVAGYQDTFFRPAHLAYLAKSHRDLVKARLVVRLKKDKSEPLVHSVQGIERYLDADEIRDYADFLVRCVIWGDSDTLRQGAEKSLRTLGESDASDCTIAVMTRLGDWEKHFQKHNSQDAANRVSGLKAQIASISVFRNLNSLAGEFMKSRGAKSRAAKQAT
jgi:hypothetical protein